MKTNLIETSDGQLLQYREGMDLNAGACKQTPKEADRANIEEAKIGLSEREQAQFLKNCQIDRIRSGRPNILTKAEKTLIREYFPNA